MGDDTWFSAAANMKHEETDTTKIASIAIALQFFVAMLNSLYRSDVTPVLCLIGFYAVQERKRNAARTYLVFLVLSAFLDVVWLSIYGTYLRDWIPSMNKGQEKVNGLLNFVWYCSCVLLIIKCASVYFVYNFYIETQGSGGYTGLSQGGDEDTLSEGSSLT